MWSQLCSSYLLKYSRPNKSHKGALDTANIMKSHYLGEGEYFDADKNMPELTTMLGDADFIYGTYHSVNAWSKNLDKPIYYYLFEHLGEFSFGDLFAIGKTKFECWNDFVKSIFFTSREAARS